MLSAPPETPAAICGAGSNGPSAVMAAANSSPMTTQPHQLVSFLVIPAAFSSFPRKAGTQGGGSRAAKAGFPLCARMTTVPLIGHGRTRETRDDTIRRFTCTLPAVLIHPWLREYRGEETDTPREVSSEYRRPPSSH